MNAALIVVLIMSGVVGIASALGVSYAVSRSSSDKERREIDKSLIDSQRLLIAQQETELGRERHRAEEADRMAKQYRSDLTQKAAVDHLLEVLVREEQQRHTEHTEQSEQQRRAAEENASLLREIISRLEGMRAGAR